MAKYFYRAFSHWGWNALLSDVALFGIQLLLNVLLGIVQVEEAMMKADTIVHNNIVYISIPDLINYLDNTALSLESVKDKHGVELLNKLADVLSKL